MTEDNAEYQFPMKCGRYTLTGLIGEGGMGEVFFAEDRICQRIVALKKLRKEWIEIPVSRERFILEPKITAKLAHPSIVPIYEIHDEKENVYFTMPYVEGESLKEILDLTLVAKLEGLSPHPVGNSVYALMLMFLNLCYAIEQAHKKGFLHRDLKPHNIIVRNSTQVVILDWGMATSTEKVEEYRKIVQETGDFPKLREGFTHPEHPLGTFDYMAPERLFGIPCTYKGDIYSLGCILYYILTLQKPFDRPLDPEEWRAQLNEKGIEKVIDPQLVAPDREITPSLARICLKCLDSPVNRYNFMTELIADIQGYIQGKPEWSPAKTYQVTEVKDWEFQENILLSKHMAISRYAGMMEWAWLMLSKEAFSGNIKLEAKVRIKPSSRGVGFLLSVPIKSERESLENGFLIWIGSKDNPGCKFLRNNVQFINKPNVFLQPDLEYRITIERLDKTFRILIDDKVVLVYQSYIPVLGGHFGLLFRDADFEMTPVLLSLGSQNVQVNCLSVPDTFLMIKDYSKALTEYRRISRSFKGRAEGREATFRAGLTLIEIGKSEKKTAKENFEKALAEFEKLHKTPGAPLEYLGKALVYQAEKNLDEETKCLELAVRMFPKHPLGPLVKEHIIFRLHETAQKDRIGAYTYALLTIRQLPVIYQRKEAQQFVKNLTVSWEDIPFIESPPTFPEEKLEQIHLSIQIAFWLARPTSLYELALEIPENFNKRHLLLENTFLTLITIGYPKLVDFILNVKLKENTSIDRLKKTFATLTSNKTVEEKISELHLKTPPKFYYPLLKEHLTLKEGPSLLPLFEKKNLPKELHIWALLLANKTQDVEKLLEGEDLPMLEGCYLAATKGEKAALAHFDNLIETTYPKTPTLLGHFLKGNIDLKSGWIKQAFLWEKLELYRQLTLYYHCLGMPRKVATYEGMVKKEFSNSQIPLNFI